MDKKETVYLLYKSSFISLTAQLVKTFSALLIRRGFLAEIGVELQGTYDVLNNILSMIQLAELGIGTAIVYALYVPIIEKDKQTICQLMNLYKKFYQKIGLLIIGIGLVLSFNITFFVAPDGYKKEYVQIAFMIMLFSTASTYFLAYKRELLYADQKQYIYQLVDIAFMILTFVGQLLSIYVLRNFYAFLIVNVVQNVGSNIVIGIICDKEYPYLSLKAVGEYKHKNQLVENLKNIVVGKIGGFVYNSTDNLIISKMVNVSSVTFLTNYTYITAMCKSVCSSLTAPIRPMLGNYVNDETKKKENVNMIFRDYTFIMFAFLGVVVTGVFNTSDLFVTMWVGENFHLSRMVVALLCTDMLLGMLQTPSAELIHVLGYFRFDKYMSIAGMIINLILSIFFVLKYGIAGVLLGTVIAQIFYFISRVSYIHKHYFQGGLSGYLGICVLYCMVILLDVVIVNRGMQFLTNLTVLLQFVFGVILSCIIPLSILVVMFRKTQTFQDVKHKFFVKDGKVNV